MRFLVFFSLFGVFWGCSPKIETNIKLFGPTQGTTYNILYTDSLGRDFQMKIDSLLTEIDNSLSTYNPKSVVSEFNEKGKINKIDYHLLRMLKESWAINQQTEKAFDPTVMPMIEYWGFGNEKIEQLALIDSTLIDSLLHLVGMSNITLTRSGKTVDWDGLYPGEYYDLINTRQGVKLNFNAIAQGYTVDAVAELLEEKGITSYMVEIGGELKVKGKNFNKKAWTVGIDKPQQSDATNREIDAILTLEDRAVATSGNYRKFYVKDGIKYSHTISPITGFPVNHSLLSATVVTDNCAKADAYATAFLVMGFEKTLQFLEGNGELEMEVYLVYSNEEGELETFVSEGLKDKIKPIKAEGS